MGSMTIHQKTSASHNKRGPSTRRQVLAAGVAGAGCLKMAAAQQTATLPAQSKTILIAKAIHQEEDFKCGARRIYEALLDAGQFRAFSGGRAAQIDRAPGGAFSLFDGHIVGRNVELAAARRIVQAWRAASWPEGVYSIARFELLEQAGGARVVLHHTGFPPEMAEGLASGWIENYWTPLRKFLS
jgi:activator of HSP90 ATPase